MRKIYGFVDSDGFIYAADDVWSLDKVELVPNPTWEQSDYTDPEGNNWIASDRLAELFNDLCKKSGMRKSALAALCGVSVSTFSRYCNGASPVPAAVWQVVDMEVSNSRIMRGRIF